MVIIDDFFNRIVSEQWFKAINATLDSNTYYPCALLLTVYTEILGGYVRGTHRSGQGRQNFNTFLKYLGDEYHKVSEEINLYNIIRHGLVHEGSPKGEFFVILSSKPEDELGVGYHLGQNGRKIVNFRLRRYFEDFIRAISKYRKELEKAEEIYQKHKKAGDLEVVDFSQFELLVNFRKAWWHNIERVEKEIEERKTHTHLKWQ